MKAILLGLALGWVLSVGPCNGIPAPNDISSAVATAIEATRIRQTADAQAAAVSATRTSTATRVLEPPPTPTATRVVVTNGCIPWRDARAHIGENTCVTGTVTRVFTDQRSGVTFIDFTTDRSAYGGFSPKIKWDSSLVGRCVKITGVIVMYQGATETVIDTREQLSFCQ